jgi:hypothetical protein
VPSRYVPRKIPINGRGISLISHSHESDDGNQHTQETTITQTEGELRAAGAHRGALSKVPKRHHARRAARVQQIRFDEEPGYWF